MNKEGYEELEDEVNEILENEAIKSIKVSQNDTFGLTHIETEKHKIIISAMGGHGGVGINYYEINYL